jgi:hypothetical protein
MTKPGREFLNELASFPPRTFENNFSRISGRLDLGAVLDGDELNLLYRAAYNATLCKIAFNGLGGCGGKIRPEQERNRRKLEAEFMAARGSFYASAGWTHLRRSQRSSIEQIFLRVLVNQENLAV